MGCISSKPQRQISESRNPVVLASETNCGCNFINYHFMLWFLAHLLLLLPAVSVSDVEALYELFKKISNAINEDDLLSKEEFQLALFRNRNKRNFFAERVFDVFDVNQKGVLDFGEFVKGLSSFHPNSSDLEKIEFTFKLYDLNRSGQISREEVKQLLASFLEESDVILPNDVMNVVLDQTFSDADSNGDGVIDKDDWTRFALRSRDVMSMMTVGCLKDVTTTFPSFIFHSRVEDSSL